MLRDSIYMQAHIAQTRANVEYTLKTYRANIVFVDQVIFHNAFSAIISTIKPAAPFPMEYMEQTSPIKTSHSRMSALDREEFLSEATDHTQDDENDEDSEDSISVAFIDPLGHLWLGVGVFLSLHNISNDESSDDEDMTPPTEISAHHRRCNESLALGNPFFMGHKRSLWSSLQSDTKRPAQKRITKSRGCQADEEEETSGTSSSYDASPLVSSTPLSKTLDVTPQEEIVQTPMSIVVQRLVQKVQDDSH